MKKTIMGLGGSAHDFSTVIMEGNNILCGIEDERVTRKKNGVTWWYDVPCKPSSDYCLEYIGKSLEQIDYIVTSDIMPARIKSYFPKLTFYNHHLLHAASVYYFVSITQMGVIVLDGWGSVIKGDKTCRTRETISFFNCNNNSIKLIGQTSGQQIIEENTFPMGISNSLGYFYNLITLLIGFGKHEEGKTMGLAGYGSTKYFDIMMKYIDINDRFTSIFTFKPYKDSLIDELKFILQSHDNSIHVKADIAASAQKVFENVLFQGVKLLIDEGHDTVGLAGGCALNSVANGKITDNLSKDKKKLVVLPHVSDAGIAFGAVAYQYHIKLDKKTSIKIKGSQNKKKIFNVARTYDHMEILNAINHYYPHLEYEVAHNPAPKIARLLSEGCIVALYYRESEFGPRALGNRSILANPQSARFRAILNRNIKFREPFRPIAPTIIDKHYSDFFEGPPDRPFMLKVARVKPNKLDLISSVVHIDGTARVQTVYWDLNPLLYDILIEYHKLTGIPVLSNTSFNRKGEPIIETPLNALEAFMNMTIDYMVLDGFVVWKPGDHPVEWV